MAVTALDIVNKAIELGFDKCGIIPVGIMYGNENRLEKRMAYFPQTKDNYESFRSFAHLQKSYSWAKAIVILSFWYEKYHIPNVVRDCVAKYYLTDGRKNTDLQGYKISVAFEEDLGDFGFQVAADRDFGITALRWAGIGIIRKNNFFYVEKGSYQHLETFLIDEPLQYVMESHIRPCSEKCNLCMKVCPTGSLEAPYMMCRNICVSCLTTWDGWDLRNEPFQNKFGK